jgi:hypothetical protein
MNCPCGVDHWHWTAAGLQGINAMLSALQTAQVPPTPQAVDKLKEQLALLQERVSAIEPPAKG